MNACRQLDYNFNVLIVDKQGNILRKITKLEDIV